MSIGFVAISDNVVTVISLISVVQNLDVMKLPCVSHLLFSVIHRHGCSLVAGLFSIGLNMLQWYFSISFHCSCVLICRHFHAV